MAKNLRDKIPEGDTLTIFDINTASTEKLKSEVSSSNLLIAKNPQEVAQNSVCLDRPTPSSLSDENYCSIHDLSWGHGFRVVLLL